MTQPPPTAQDWFPVLSTAERDRRYRLLRQLMDRLEVGALLVSGNGRDQLDRYVTNEGRRGYALLPHDGSPISIVTNGNSALNRYDVPGKAFERWVADEQLLTRDRPLADILRDAGLAGERIGVVGLSSRAPASVAGTIPYNVFVRLQDALPAATFVDVSPDYEMVMVVHSDEELAMIRKSAQLGERACAAMVATAGVGARECEIVAAGMREIFAGGGMTFPGPERCGPERLGWTSADWLWMGGGSWRMAEGDTFGAELFTFYGGFESQQQVDIAVGEPDADHKFLDEVAAESYRRGLAVLRPGITFAELCDAMEAPLRESGCWNMGPVVQTVSPVIYNSATHVGLDEQPGLRDVPHPPTTPRDGDFVIEPGVAFAFEPNACRDKKRVCIGGTVIVTPDGFEELNSMSNRLNVVAA